jgi:hypothetical protein
MKYKLNINSINYCIFATLTFFISLHIFSYYTAGDQEYYIEFYNSISGVEFNEVKNIAYKIISATEPLSLLVLWLGSSIFSLDKAIWISLLNSVFIVLFYRFLNKNNTPMIVVVLLMTCFYTLVMLYSAERLKLAFMVIFLALNTSGMSKNILFLLSPLFHFQVLAFFPIIFIYQFRDKFKNIFVKLTKSKSMLIKLSLVIFSMIFIVLLNYDGFMHKFDSYFYREKTTNAQLMTFLKISLFTLIAMKESKDKLKVGVSFLPWFVFGFMFGGQRIIIMVFAWFVYLLVIEQKLQRPLPMIILIYFSVKSFSFIDNIYNFGSGFFVPAFLT